MKYLFTLILGVTSLIGVGQGNIVDTNKVWSSIYGSAWDNSSTSYEYKIGQDSVINSDTFYNVVHKKHGTTNWVKSYFYLKEKNQKVHITTIINGIITNTGILYDFSVSIGDTVFLSNESCDSSEFTLTKIESVNINGFSHQQYTYEPTSNSTAVENLLAIPNIGSRSGLLYSFSCVFDIGSTLLCVHESGNQIYDNTFADGNCYVEGSNSINSEINSKISITTHNNVVLVSSDEIIKTIKVIDILGNNINLYNVNSKEATINISNSSILFLQVEYQDDMMEIAKIPIFSIH